MYTLEDIQLAYTKLKTYIYYDNTELLLRQKLVEFETDTKKDVNSFVNWAISEPYSSFEENSFENIFNVKEKTIESNLKIKFERILFELNNYDEESEFFKYVYESIGVSFFPKKISSNNVENDVNFITNKKTDSEYVLEKIIAFIDVPIEIHLLSILWIIKYGYKFDSELLDVCKGNRLLLNNDKTALVQSSSLFKPYFSQYQQWRDESVTTAQNLIKNDKNALFINLDIKDYFNSSKIDLDLYFPINENDSINIVLKKIHQLYYNLLSETYEFTEKKITQIDNKSI